jgi:hypothetical protein
MVIDNEPVGKFARLLSLAILAAAAHVNEDLLLSIFVECVLLLSAMLMQSKEGSSSQPSNWLS